ncbi:nagb/rpia/CoA transferase-like protein [Trichodelitschia bisporula]|uniref:Nagb/rpia/CoA transferase-like protein n=1 Tax=Trichodelitschia bisporula TaxID=703511 RepID=A0A6G1HNQ2_9PEZI|nr:nagb/rpia/CoA transferase-like protein [Trichodelitschia bisporula]
MSVVLYAIKDIITDYQSGASDLAIQALQALEELNDKYLSSSLHPDERWNQLCAAGLALGTCRPAMGAAILGVISQALVDVRSEWDRTGARRKRDDGDDTYAQAFAGLALGSAVSAEYRLIPRITDQFIAYVRQLTAHTNPPTPLRILTLSSSSTLLQCLSSAILDHNTAPFDICILESRPGCEGAAFALSLLDMLEENPLFSHRATVTVAPDSHAALLAQDVDLLLLGADHIAPNGDVCNKTGSRVAASVARAVRPDSRVVVVSQTSKITNDHREPEEHDAEEVTRMWEGVDAEQLARYTASGALRVKNVYFEYVPADLIDAYITGHGKLDVEDIQSIAEHRKKREEDLFSSSEVQEEARRMIKREDWQSLIILYIGTVLISLALSIRLPGYFPSYGFSSQE